MTDFHVICISLISQTSPSIVGQWWCLEWCHWKQTPLADIMWCQLGFELSARKTYCDIMLLWQCTENGLDNFDDETWCYLVLTWCQLVLTWCHLVLTWCHLVRTWCHLVWTCVDMIPPGVDMMPPGVDTMPTGIDMMPPGVHMMPPGVIMD